MKCLISKSFHNFTFEKFLLLFLATKLYRMHLLKLDKTITGKLTAKVLPQLENKSFLVLVQGSTG